MNYSQLKQYLAKNAPERLYLIQGEEIFLVNGAVNLFKNYALSQQEKNIVLDILNGDECTSQDILNAADSMSLLGGEKLIIVKNTQSLKAKDQEQLLKYFSRPAPFTVLVFVVEGKLDKRKKFFKSFEEYGKVVSCPTPSQNECTGWLKQEAQNNDCELAYDAAKYLLEVCGKDLQLLNNELNKIITFVGKKRNINLSDVESVLGRGPSYSIFQLTDALGEKQLKAALPILDQLLEESHHPLQILTMVTNQLRKIALLKQLTEKGVPAKQACQQLRILPFLQNNLIKQAGNFTPTQIKQALASILATDIKLKSSAQSPRILLENLFINLCST